MLKVLSPQDEIPGSVMPGSRFSRMKFSYKIASAHLSRMKQLINTSVWKNP